ncbi:MAG: hypothetical protein CMN00_03115 [Rickettsiales bacterium]|mgnify:CR=1 FL=1|nr:hypothetical protein [Rickettsiales bacterium]|tara:strand:- start:3 stop:914 length:912 start_codon:yes stop_codon:yes gene_type:complete
MRFSPLGYFLAGAAAIVGTAYALRSTAVGKIFNAPAHWTAADLEEMQIERSGQTLDTIPVGLTEAFMGYQFLDLEHTTMVANDAPWGPGVIDVQAVYENPYDLGYSDDDLMMAAEENYLMADMNRRSHPMKEYVPKELAAEMPGHRSFESQAPGQAPYLTSTGQPPSDVKVRHPSVPISQTPGVGVYNNSPRALGVPKPPPEAFVDMPYMVSIVDAPFIVSDAPEQGANRFGSLSRESGEENYNGRMGKLSLDPSVNASYTGPDGTTASLDQWSRTHTLLRHSDTTVQAIPQSGGFEIMLRRV